jgi:hypothetical protein
MSIDVGIDIMSVDLRHRFDDSSGTWLFISTWCRERIREISLRNEGIDCGVEQTNANRGAIGALRSLLAVADPEPEVESFAPDPDERY